MSAGLQDSPVARFENRKVTLEPIPEQAQDRLQYHNALLGFCSLPLRQLVESMQYAEAKSAQTS